MAEIGRGARHVFCHLIFSEYWYDNRRRWHGIATLARFDGDPFMSTLARAGMYQSVSAFCYQRFLAAASSASHRRRTFNN